MSSVPSTTAAQQPQQKPGGGGEKAQIQQEIQALQQEAAQKGVNIGSAPQVHGKGAKEQIEAWMSQAQQKIAAAPDKNNQAQQAMGASTVGIANVSAGSSFNMTM